MAVRSHAAGSIVSVTQGSHLGHTFLCTSAVGRDVVGTDPLAFEQTYVKSADLRRLIDSFDLHAVTSQRLVANDPIDLTSDVTMEDVTANTAYIREILGIEPAMCIDTPTWFRSRRGVDGVVRYTNVSSPRPTRRWWSRVPVSHRMIPWRAFGGTLTRGCY